jgi:inhibitor of KinA sporulation pathway (predicted exonuclease)
MTTTQAVRPAHYLVIDLEATCADNGSIPKQIMEIIEIGAVLLDGRALQPIAEFQTFVRPVRRPKLTPFCQQLTSIRQEDVDAAPRFPEALGRLVAALWQGKDALFCSWGAYDRGQFEQDCRFHGIAYPFGAQHLNLKALFAQRRGMSRQLGMAAALREAGLQLRGTHHRGIDDARNIARLLPLCLGAVA